MQEYDRAAENREVDDGYIYLLPELFKSKIFNNVDLVKSVAVFPWMDHIRIYSLEEWYHYSDT